MLATALLAAAMLSAPPSAKWLGQDGRDHVGPYPEKAGNDVQDVHLKLFGLPSKRALSSLVLTGHGGDRWEVNGPPGSWPAHFERQEGSPTADLYFEPLRRETGREFHVEIAFKDGTRLDFYVRGGRAEMDKRVAGASLTAQWLGHSGDDECGGGPSVGPDGYEDVTIVLGGLSPKVAVESVAIDSKGLPGWEHGPNPKGRANAELVRDPKVPSKARLFLQPEVDLADRTLSMTLVYVGGRSDRVQVKAGRCQPNKRLPAPFVPKLATIALKTTWKGQGPNGFVHVGLEGLPEGRPIAAAVLSDGVRGCWAWRSEKAPPAHADDEALPLAIEREGTSTRALLSFRPIRDETGETLVLRLVGPEGRAALAEFPGGACDPALAAPAPTGKATRARPGDDLQSLLDTCSTVLLAPGTYRLDRPLVLSRPVAMIGEGRPTLLFRQRPGSPPWTAAITIHRGRTTLEGLSVRFEGQVRWDQTASYGPAVIGTTLPTDPQGLGGAKTGLRLAHLDLESPPAAKSGTWEESLRLMRLVSAEGGAIVGNRLRGGMAEFAKGPWTIEENEWTGTPPYTWSHAVFAGHHVVDLVMAKNRAEPKGPSGKAWRFVVLTQRGTNVKIRENTIKRVGPFDDDPLPCPNAPEVVLTESYRLHFEGRPRAITSDGRLIVVPTPPGGPAPTGAVVALLNGPQAGQWRRVAQAIDPQTYWVEPPLPVGDCDVVIASGFVNASVTKNRIDAQGSKQASLVVLAGNHYGARVLDNHLLGGAEALRLMATATEAPGPWGRSRAPFLGAVVKGNTIEGAAGPSRVEVETGPKLKGHAGRTYLSGEFVGVK